MTKKEIIRHIQECPKLSDVMVPDILNQFVEYVEKGSEMQPSEVLFHIVNGYVDNCGISAVPRTLYVWAGNAVLISFGKTDENLKRIVEDTDVVSMDLFNKNYRREDHDYYGITQLDDVELLEWTLTEVQYNIPEKVKYSLCWGIFLWLKSLPKKI